jgi:ribosome-binding ATPase YchF (GTP1/OBG family)
MEKGFIRAEVTGYNDFINCGSYAIAREKGLTRLEGKEYVMQDGDMSISICSVKNCVNALIYAKLIKKHSD